MRRPALPRFTLLTIGYNLAVILWGAWVRASGSGAGCGAHWPLCGGEVIPQSPTMHTLTELAHRLTSTIALAMVGWMIVLARREFPARHPARRWAWLSLLFILVEALIGAGLVLFRYVGTDDSIARAVWLGAHLVNTLLMLAVFWLTWWSAQERRVPALREMVRRQPMLLVALVALMLTGVAGAVASLSGTLFPSASLAEGLARDFSPTAHLLLRLRVLHPFLAIGAGLLWLALARRAAARHDSETTVGAAARTTLIMVGVQWAIGAMTWMLNVPVAAQLLHLLGADLLWLSGVHLSLALLTAQDGRTSPASS